MRISDWSSDVCSSDLTPAVTVTEIWTADAGKGEGLLGARQAPVVADGRVYAAAVEGGVHAFDLQTGNPVWTYESDLRLSGGPGVGEGVVAVGSLEGDVIALDAVTGAEKWTAKVDNEVIAAPRSEEHTSELQSLMRISYAVFCLKKQKKK